MSIEPTPEEWAMRERRIECPVEWCDGQWVDHGGDGSEPESWIHHEDEGIELPHGASLSRSQQGAGPVEWSLAMRGDGATYSMASGVDPATFAKALRDIADAIEATGGELGA